MKKKNKIILLITLTIVVLIFLGFLIKKFNAATIFEESLSEAQLKNEYNTLFSDATDSSPSNDPNLLINNNLLQFRSSGSANEVTSVLLDKKDLYGNEIVAILTGSLFRSGSTTNSINSYCDFLGTRMNCNTQGEKGYDKYFPCENLVIKAIPQTLTPNNYDIYVNGQLINTIQSQKPFYPQLSCSHPFYYGSSTFGYINYIGYRPQFSCDLSENEVWIQENFGTEFDINDLSFLPTKFCKEARPFTLRDLLKGETQITPNPIPLFNKGEKLVPPKNTIITVNYAAYSVAGITPPCNPTDGKLIKEENKWICKKFIEALIIVKQCNQNSDCPQPLKNNCPGYFTGCINDFCTYNEEILNSVACSNEIVTITKDKEKITETNTILVPGDTSFVFTSTYPKSIFSFGDEEFSSSVDFLCKLDEENNNFNYPNPKEECYSTLVNFMERTYNVFNGYENKVNDYISFIGYKGGRVKFDDNSNFNSKRDLTTSYLILITDPFSDLKVDYELIEVLKDSIKNINIKFKNNLPTGKAIIKTTQKVDKTNEIINDFDTEIEIKNGENSVEFILNTENLGINKISIQIFYKIEINNKIILVPSTIYELKYNIVQQYGVQKEVITITEKATETTIIKPEKKISKIIYLSVILLLIVIIFFIMRKRIKKW